MSVRFLSVLLILGITGLTPSFAEEGDWDNLDLPPQYQAVPYQETQTPVTQQPTFQAVQQPKRSWLSKLLRPFGQRIIENPPIMQPKKQNIEPPRITPVSPYPLIRLTQGFEYQGISVPPGFYLVQVQSGQGEDLLVLQRQQQTVVSIPATRSGQTLPIAPVSLAGSSEQKKNKQSHASQPQPEETAKKTQPTATARVEQAAEGQGLVLIHELGGLKYTSIPLQVRF